MNAILPDYSHLTNDELLNLAQGGSQLTDCARAALQSELTRRTISPEDISAYARHSRAMTEMARRLQQRATTFYEGSYKKFVGRTDASHDRRFKIDEYDSTLWLVVGLPLFLIATYRIRLLRRRWWQVCPSGRIHVLEKKALNWNQVVLTWLRYASGMGGFFLLLLLLRRSSVP